MTVRTRNDGSIRLCSGILFRTEGHICLRSAAGERRLIRIREAIRRRGRAIPESRASGWQSQRQLSLPTDRLRSYLTRRFCVSGTSLGNETKGGNTVTDSVTFVPSSTSDAQAQLALSSRFYFSNDLRVPRKGRVHLF